MAKRQMSEEQKQALRERLAKARAVKAAKTNTPETKVVQPETANQPDDLLAQLLAKVNALESELQTNRNVDQHLETKREVNLDGPTYGRTQIGGNVVTVYPMDPALYPDPCERLLNDGEFRRFALADNFSLIWRVEGQVYETKFGMQQEPFFFLQLSQHRYDDRGQRVYVLDENGKKIYQGYNRGILRFNEDATLSTMLARDLGYDPNTADFKELMDEVRYYRIKEFIRGKLIPYVPPMVQQGVQELVDPVTGGAVAIVNTAEAA